MNNHSQPDETAAPDIGLDVEQTQRVMMYLAKSMGEFTREELIAKVEVIDDWYRSYITDMAMWNLWTKGEVEFDVDNKNEIIIRRVA